MSEQVTIKAVKERTEMIEGLVRGLKVSGDEQTNENMRAIANMLAYNLLDLNAALAAAPGDALDAVMLDKIIALSEESGQLDFAEPYEGTHYDEDAARLRAERDELRMSLLARFAAMTAARADAERGA